MVRMMGWADGAIEKFKLDMSNLSPSQKRAVLKIGYGSTRFTLPFVYSLYSVDDFGRIDSPGAFVGEQIWAPYFFYLCEEGIAHKFETDVAGRITRFFIDLDSDDIVQFPELLCHDYMIVELHELPSSYNFK